jgi:hypothetical protein
MDPLVLDSHKYNPPNSFIVNGKPNLSLQYKCGDKFSYNPPITLNFYNETNSLLITVLVPDSELQTVPTLFVDAHCTQGFDF